MLHGMADLAAAYEMVSEGLELAGHEPVTKTLEPSVGTLLRWAARDDDRTQLYGVELRVDCATGEFSVVEHDPPVEELSDALKRAVTPLGRPDFAT